MSRGPETGWGQVRGSWAEGWSMLGGPGSAGPGALEEERWEQRPRQQVVLLADVGVAGHSGGLVPNV